MKRRLLLILGLLLGAAIAVVVLDPYQVVSGAWHGETFYALRPTSYWSRVLAEEGSAWQGLKNAGRPAVPFLIERLKDGDGLTRERAAALLGHQGMAAHEALPLLLEILRTDHGPVDAETIKTMQQVQAIKKAYPDKDVDMQIKDADERLRYTAAEALRDIDPEMAKRIGLP